MVAAVATVLAAAVGVLLAAMQLVVRLRPYLAACDPATVGYTTSSCHVGGCARLAYSLWFPIEPRPALPYFSYLQAQASQPEPAPPWILAGRAGRFVAALALALAPHIFRSIEVGSTSVAHWSIQHTTRSRNSNQHAIGGSGGLVIMVQGFEAFTFIAADLCEALATRGFAVAAIDLSQHEAVEARLVAVTALLEHVLAEYSAHLDPDRVVVVGHSRGGSQGAYLALSDARIQGAVLLHSNAGDMQTLMGAQPLRTHPTAVHPQHIGRRSAALLVVHATDDTAVRAENHDAWVTLLDEYRQDVGDNVSSWHAVVDAPCGHDGCTSLLTMLSFALPRWVFATLSHLSSRIPALRTLCVPGVTELRAKQLVATTSNYVCDFVEATLAQRNRRGSDVLGDAAGRVQTRRLDCMQLFDGTATWLHTAGYWRLRGVTKDSDRNTREAQPARSGIGRSSNLKLHHPFQQPQDTPAAQHLRASI